MSTQSTTVPTTLLVLSYSGCCFALSNMRVTMEQLALPTTLFAFGPVREGPFSDFDDSPNYFRQAFHYRYEDDPMAMAEAKLLDARFKLIIEKAEREGRVVYNTNYRPDWVEAINAMLIAHGHQPFEYEDYRGISYPTVADAMKVANPHIFVLWKTPHQPCPVLVPAS